MVVKPYSKQLNKLKCIQINLRHSKSASLHFFKLLIDLDIDIAIIQEPYANINIFDNEIQIPSLQIRSDQITIEKIAKEYEAKLKRKNVL